ncbi:MAG: glycosyltransferase family 4 protein [Bacteroidetes bacterium]|nr:glycosyltransferase family 4 protein [Bacteroidota bacterium]
MKIAYVSTHNARDVHSWSGTVYHIAQALQAQQTDLEYIDNLKSKFDLALKVKGRLYGMLDKRYLHDREYFVVRDYAAQITRRVSSSANVLFSPGSTPMAMLSTKKPKVFYTDATFAGLINSPYYYSNLCKESLVKGKAIDQASLDSATLAIYCSDWAAKTAIDNYKVDPQKVKVVPYGANVSHNLDYESIKAVIARRSRTKCQLLFLGVEWDRKGGDMALKVLEELNKGGLPTELHIAGIRKFPFEKLPANVVDHGFISKGTSEGREKINQLLMDSHFLLVPTKAEAFGFVFCEANAFGVPDIATNVGGIPTIVKDDVNGKLFDLSAPAREYADYIIDLFHHYERYEEMALASFNEYKTRLNWEVCGKKLKELMQSVI